MLPFLAQQAPWYFSSRPCFVQLMVLWTWLQAKSKYPKQSSNTQPKHYDCQEALQHCWAETLRVQKKDQVLRLVDHGNLVVWAVSTRIAMKNEPVCMLCDQKFAYVCKQNRNLRILGETVWAQLPSRLPCPGFKTQDFEESFLDPDPPPRLSLSMLEAWDPGVFSSESWMLNPKRSGSKIFFRILNLETRKICKHFPGCKIQDAKVID